MYDDPGWNFTWKSVPRILLGTVALGYVIDKARKSGADGLQVMRDAFLSMAVIGIVAVTIFGALLASGVVGNADAPEWLSLVFLAVMVVQVVAPSRISRPLDTTDGEQLAQSYSTRLFLQMAFAGGVVMTGCAAAMYLGAWWLLPTGAVLGGIGYYRAAPTVARLAAEQELVRQEGSPLSLVDALRQMGGTDG